MFWRCFSRFADLSKTSRCSHFRRLLFVVNFNTSHVNPGRCSSTTVVGGSLLLLPVSTPPAYITKRLARSLQNSYLVLAALVLYCTVGPHRVTGISGRIHALLGGHPRGNRGGLADERKVSRKHDQGGGGQGRCGRFGQGEEDRLPWCRRRIITPPRFCLAWG